MRMLLCFICGIFFFCFAQAHEPKIRTLECQATNFFGYSHLNYDRETNSLKTVTNGWLKANYPVAYVNQMNGEWNNQRVTEIVYTVGSEYYAIKFHEVLATTPKKRPATLAQLLIPGISGPFTGNRYREVASLQCFIEFWPSGSSVYNQ